MASNPKYPTNTPIGRIVEGDVWTASDKDSTGQLRVIKNGPNAGKPNPQFYIGLAIPKMINGQPNQDWAAFWAFTQHVANSSWPNLFNNGQCVRQDFAWKIRDGDTHVTKEGKPLRERPGCAGHWILSIASSFAPEIGMETSPGVFAAITDKELVKRGYWVQVAVSVSSNGSMQTPGLYINLDKVLLRGKGEVISSGRSMAEAFGGQAAGTQSALPEGMQALTAQDMSGGFSMGGQPGQMQPQQGGFPQGGPAGGGFPQGGPAGGGFPQGQPQQGGFPQGGGFVPSAAGQGPGAFAPPATGFPGSPQVGFSQGQPQGGGSGQFQGAGLPAGGNPAMGGPGGPLAQGGPANASISPPPGFAGPAGQTASPSSGYSGFMGAAPVMLPAAAGNPYEMFKATGWTDEQLIAQGYMAARA